MHAHLSPTGPSIQRTVKRRETGRAGLMERHERILFLSLGVGVIRLPAAVRALGAASLRLLPLLQALVMERVSALADGADLLAMHGFLADAAGIIVRVLAVVGVRLVGVLEVRVLFGFLLPVRVRRVALGSLLLTGAGLGLRSVEPVGRREQLGNLAGAAALGRVGIAATFRCFGSTTPAYEGLSWRRWRPGLKMDVVMTRTGEGMGGKQREERQRGVGAQR